LFGKLFGPNRAAARSGAVRLRPGVGQTGRSSLEFESPRSILDTLLAGFNPSPLSFIMSTATHLQFCTAFIPTFPGWIRPGTMIDGSTQFTIILLPSGGTVKRLAMSSLAICLAPRYGAQGRLQAECRQDPTSTSHPFSRYQFPQGPARYCYGQPQPFNPFQDRFEHLSRDRHIRSRCAEFGVEGTIEASC